MKRVTTILILTLMALPGFVFAQTCKTVRAEVPFEFIVNGKIMPTAAYTMMVSGDSQPILSIRSGKNAALIVPTATASLQGSSDSVLVFHRYGAQRFLSAFRCEDRSYELPAGKAEMELRTKRATEGEVVLVAAAR